MTILNEDSVPDVCVTSNQGILIKDFNSENTEWEDSWDIDYLLDPDSIKFGIAIDVTENDNNGTWQYDINDGAGFRDIPTDLVENDNSYFLLRETDKIRFVPENDWHSYDSDGENSQIRAPRLKFVAWDQTEYDTLYGSDVQITYNDTGTISDSQNLTKVI